MYNTYEALLYCTYEDRSPRLNADVQYCVAALLYPFTPLQRTHFCRYQ
jgi:hypothetical protein